MDTTPFNTGSIPVSEAETARQARIAWEAQRIAEADADITAGRLVGSAKVQAWVSSLGTDQELPDLDAIRQWLAQPGAGTGARRKLMAVAAAVERLTRQPCLHPFGDQAGVGGPVATESKMHFGPILLQ